MKPAVALARLARGKSLTLKELEQVQYWLDADWESHDAMDRDGRKLVQRLLITVREGVRRDKNYSDQLDHCVSTVLFRGPMLVSTVYKVVAANSEHLKRQVDDVVWDLVQRGKIRIRPDSVLEWVR